MLVSLSRIVDVSAVKPDDGDRKDKLKEAKEGVDDKRDR